MENSGDQSQYPQDLYMKLRSRNLELAEQLTREQRRGRRFRAMATLYHMAHEFCGMTLPLPNIGKRFLRITLDLMSLDFGAFLEYRKQENRFVAIHSLGFTSEEEPGFTPHSRLGEFHIVHHDTPSDPRVAELRRVAGGDCLLWAYSPRFELALLMGGTEEEGEYHRIFTGEDQEIVTSALRIMCEIRERRRFRDETVSKKERLELALEGTNLGTWDWNVKTNEVVYDSRWMEMLGYRPGELPSNYKTWRDRVNPHDLPGVLHDLKEHLEGRTPNYAVKHRLRAKDDSWRWILASGKVVERDEDGKPLRVTGTHLDITRQMQVEEEISKFKTISDRANYGTAIVDFNGDVIYLNDCFAGMHGYKPEELIGSNLSVFHNEEQMPLVIELNRKLFEEGFYELEEVWHVRRNGDPFPTLMNGLVIKDEQDHPLYLAATAIDITDRKRTEAALRETLIRLEKSHSDMLSILNELSLGTALFDEKGRITYLNQVGERLLGCLQEQALGRTWREVLPFQDHQMKQLEATIAQPAQVRAKVSGSWLNEEGLPFQMEIEVKDDPRDAQKRILFFYDTSELHNLRKLLDKEASYRDLIGKSKPMQTVFEQIQQLCKVDATVLIEGDTGTGKELVARALHYGSHRRSHPFVVVNCSGLTESVLQSQLFGHKKGSFTGAVENHRGVFEEANRGTVFLDEIAGISPAVQANLLRVLDQREITPVGETKPRHVDVRILAASNQVLAEEVEAGRFRADLMYRIRVVRITLPALIDRREDIPLLANAFLGQARASSGKDLEGISSEAMSLLMEYHWPGNVRELKNAIDYASIQCSSHRIRAGDLPPEIKDMHLNRIRNTRETLTEEERLLNALKQAKGNRTVAAQLLGISRATFYRRLAQFNINVDK